jgi:hypothetical protein
VGKRLRNSEDRSDHSVGAIKLRNPLGFIEPLGLIQLIELVEPDTIDPDERDDQDHPVG